MRCNFPWLSAIPIGLLCGLVFAPDAASSGDITDLAEDLINGREVIHRVNVNDLVDEHSQLIDELIPMVSPPKLDDVKLKLISNVYLLLEQGYLRNMSSTKRVGDCVLTYKRRVLTVDLKLGWHEVKFDYRYLVKLLLYKRSGLVLGKVNDLEVNIALDFDLNSYETRLRGLDFLDSGNIDLKLEGRLLDWLYNLMIRSVTYVCRQLVLKAMEIEFTTMIERRIEELNAILGKLAGQPSHLFKFVNMLPPNRYSVPDQF